MQPHLTLYYEVVAKSLGLSALEKAHLVERLMVDLEQRLARDRRKEPLLNWLGLWRNYGTAPSAEEIEEMRREAWSGMSLWCPTTLRRWRRRS
jgi:hypothetical protein